MMPAKEIEDGVREIIQRIAPDLPQDVREKLVFELFKFIYDCHEQGVAQGLLDQINMVSRMINMKQNP